VYSGIHGAYSELALAHFLRERGLAFELQGAPSFRDVIARVESLRADVGILPIENAIAGTIRESYDSIGKFKHVPIAEVRYRTDHRLLGVRGAALADVREILAHPLVIAECGKFLAGLHGARAIPCEDTGVAAREVARAGNPAIAALAPHVDAAEYGLVQLAANCAEHPETFTRFLIFRSRYLDESDPLANLPKSSARKTSLAFALPGNDGHLAACLRTLGESNVAVTKLESRERLGRAGEYIFYLDVEGDAADEGVARALAAIKKESSAFVMIGSYDAHVGPLAGIVDEPAPPAPAQRRAPEPAAAPVKPASNGKSAQPRSTRDGHPASTSLHIGPVTIGDGDFVIIGGPCSVESRDQIMSTAQAVKARGAVMLRGGCFKPRTSPYSFQGLGWEGAELLAEAGRASGLPTISEVMTIDQVERMAEQVDVLQIGARNMQNFDLLKAVGRSGHPAMLKRGLSATVEELLFAAEYIMSEGNPNVMLCERGIRTFETATRNTLDLSAVPVLRERSHLPVLVDPSHGVGVRRWIRPLCRAAKAVGAHGLLIEVHPNPPEAKSDAEQALTFDDFAEIVAELNQIPLFDPDATTAYR
jgi:chorismate mutase/prephenate dehydratase